MLRVHHFSTYPHGGAAVAAKRLHAGLLAHRIDSRFWFFRNENQTLLPPATSCLSNVTADAPAAWNWWAHSQQRQRRRRIITHYQKHLAQREPHQETFSMAEHLEHAALPNDVQPGDIVHLHWIAFLADYPHFFAALPARSPLVWTLHDMNPFTGGCHFSGNCSRFLQGCGNCPQLESRGPQDLSHHTFALKQRQLARRELHVTAPSQWMLRQAQQSPLWPQQTTFHHIPYGLDLKVFRPLARREARARLGLDPDVTLIGFGADQISNPRKGYSYLETALALSTAQRSTREALIIGGGLVDGARLSVRRAHSLGFVADPEQQALAYAACDLFVVPSLSDNQPQMALEAMACGVPVIAFAAGGIPEIVETGVTGWCVPTGDLTGLAQALDQLINDSEMRGLLSQRCRWRMCRDHDLLQQANRFRNLYQSLPVAPTKSVRRA